MALCGTSGRTHAHRTAPACGRRESTYDRGCHSMSSRRRGDRTRAFPGSGEGSAGGSYSGVTLA